MSCVDRNWKRESKSTPSWAVLVIIKVLLIEIIKRAEKNN